MRTIVSPVWDGLWIWSGIPIGIVLALSPMSFATGIAIAIMLLESAHLVSPVLLAWTHRELRQVVLREWVRHLVLPPLLITATALAPAVWVFGLYWVWNIFHFGMQNFGVASLYFPGGDRVRRGLICLAVTVFGMGLLPTFVHNHFVTAFCYGVFGFQHWLTDIGMSSQVSRYHWLFIAVVLALGLVWLLLRQGPLSVEVFSQIVQVRAGMGFVHFLYSARIWRLGDPRIGPIIRKELLCVRTG